MNTIPLLFVAALLSAGIGVASGWTGVVAGTLHVGAQDPVARLLDPAAVRVRVQPPFGSVAVRTWLDASPGSLSPHSTPRSLDGSWCVVRTDYRGDDRITPNQVLVAPVTAAWQERLDGAARFCRRSDVRLASAVVLLLFGQIVVRWAAVAALTVCSAAAAWHGLAWLHLRAPDAVPAGSLGVGACVAAALVGMTALPRRSLIADCASRIIIGALAAWCVVALAPDHTVGPHAPWTVVLASMAAILPWIHRTAATALTASLLLAQGLGMRDTAAVGVVITVTLLTLARTHGATRDIRARTPMENAA